MECFQEIRSAIGEISDKDQHQPHILKFKSKLQDQLTRKTCFYLLRESINHVFASVVEPLEPKISATFPISPMKPPVGPDTRRDSGIELEKSENLITEIDEAENVDIRQLHAKFLQLFFEKFTNVKVYLAYEKLFTRHEDKFKKLSVYVVRVGKRLLSLLDAEKEQQDECLASFTASQTLWETAEQGIDWVMKLLRFFSRMDDLSEMIGREDGVSMITAIMKKFPYMTSIQISSSAVLANMASIESNREPLLEHGSIQLIMDNMKKFTSTPAILSEICATIANISTHDATAKLIVKTGGCHLLLKLMRIYPDATDLQIQAFHSFASLGKNCKDVLDKEEFTKMLLKTFENHGRHAELMSAACSALGSLAFAGVIFNAYKDSIITMVFKCMKEFKSNQGFQITACFALAHLSFLHVTNETIIQTHNGIGLILTAMQSFPLNESLQTTALFALGSIVMANDKHREAVIENNGVRIILGAMGRDYSGKKKDARVARFEKRRQKELGMASSTETIIIEDNDEEDIPERASETVEALDDEDDEDVEIEGEVSFDGFSEPVLVTRGSTASYEKSSLLQLFGSACFLNLSENDKCKKAIIAQGGLHFIFEAARRVSSKSELWNIIYYVFTKLSLPNDNLVRALALEDRAVYLRPKKVPSLYHLCSRVAMRHFVASHRCERFMEAFKSEDVNEESEEGVFDTLTGATAVADAEIPMEDGVDEEKNGKENENDGPDSDDSETSSILSLYRPNKSSNKTQTTTSQSTPIPFEFAQIIKRQLLPHHIKSDLMTHTKACSICTLPCSSMLDIRYYRIVKPKRATPPMNPVPGAEEATTTAPAIHEMSFVCSKACMDKDKNVHLRMLYEVDNLPG